MTVLPSSMSWTPANSIDPRAAHPSRFRVLSEHRESTDPSQILTSSPTLRPHKSFSCNTYAAPRKCCKQKTYGPAKPFRCNRLENHCACACSITHAPDQTLTRSQLFHCCIDLAAPGRCDLTSE